MIAPTDFSQELELYLYLSSKVQVAFKLPAAQLLKDGGCALPQQAWWSLWRCDLLKTEASGQQHVLLFTNATTCLSFVCVGFSDDFEGLLAEFEAVFVSSLKANGLQLPENVTTQMRLLKGQPRALIGTMKQLSQYALNLMDQHQASLAEVEMRLHDYPCSVLKDQYPGRAYLRQLDANPPLGAPLSLPDNVLIPFPGAPSEL